MEIHIETYLISFLSDNYQIWHPRGIFDGGMIPSLTIIWSSFCICLANFRLICLRFFLKGLTPSTRGMSCWMTSPLYPFNSSWFQEKVSLNSLMRSKILDLLFSVVPFPILTILGSIFVLMLNSKASSVCLLGFFLLKTSCLSKRFSKGMHPLGKVLFWNFMTSKFMESSKKFIWELVISFLFSINLMIWLSSSKTCQCSKLSRMDGLKRTSILQRSRSGPS